MNSNKEQSQSLPPETVLYYEMGREAKRLSGVDGELEYVRTKEIISRYLPRPPAVVLDVGGGPGAYACWLAQQGFGVHLIDPIPLHVEQAREASRRQPEFPISSITLGDARSIGFADESSDVVLLLGPLYHLTDYAERLSALREAFRVLRPGGLLIAVAISKFASACAGLIDGYIEDDDFVRIIQRDLAEGQHRNPTQKARYFTTAFFHHPAELEREVVSAGFSVKRILAVEGAAVFLQDLESQWRDPARRERILEVLRWLEAEPSLLGVTGHIAAVGIKTDRSRG